MSQKPAARSRERISAPLNIRIEIRRRSVTFPWEKTHVQRMRLLTGSHLRRSITRTPPTVRSSLGRKCARSHDLFKPSTRKLPQGFNAQKTRLQNERFSASAK